MVYIFKELGLEELSRNFDASQNGLNVANPFIHPGWQSVWQKCFSPSDRQICGLVTSETETIGLIALRINNGVARFIADGSVFDYLDFMVKPGHQLGYFELLMKLLKQKQVEILELESLTSRSEAYNYLLPMAKEKGFQIICEQADVSPLLDLPADFDKYMSMLEPHQRHELKRKLRRLDEALTPRLEINANPESVEILLEQMEQSHPEKALFLSPEMRCYFRQLAHWLAGQGYLRLVFLKTADTTLASLFCFDYNNIRYLYNSGYRPEYSHLSVGVLSKMLAIKDAIEKGYDAFDFLRGEEKYKFHLGGKSQPVYKCQINLNNQVQTVG
ncbi:MAG: acetyltransferase [Dehalococcoides mccartyi]|uniref:GNAT family N-acetyltransferase n=1 Tax=Dehalococcoides mccartyi TaxID=61435 RepID=UPI00080485BF|nr:GNAT family N-acetyltransferase [Dehalococcoides mccartyi]OBW63475.1 MAG: acetyltransferase [Dehalococcoides mccartyi]